MTSEIDYGLFTHLQYGDLEKLKNNKIIVKKIKSYYKDFLNEERKQDFMIKARFYSRRDMRTKELQTTYSKEALTTLDIGSLKISKIFYNEYIEDRNIISHLKENEHFLIDNYLQDKKCKETKIEGNHNEYAGIYEIEYAEYDFHYNNVVTNKLKYEITPKYVDGKLMADVNKQFFNISDDFYFENVKLNHLCKGVALKLFNDLSYEEFVGHFPPLFKKKYLRNGQITEMANSLKKNKFIEDSQKKQTLFHVDWIKDKINWIGKPSYTFRYFFSKLPIELFDEKYLLENKDNKQYLNPNKLLEHFENINRDNWDSYKKKTESNINKFKKGKTVNGEIYITDKGKRYIKLDEIINNIEV